MQDPLFEIGPVPFINNSEIVARNYCDELKTWVYDVRVPGITEIRKGKPEIDIKRASDAFKVRKEQLKKGYL